MSDCDPIIHTDDWLIIEKIWYAEFLEEGPKISL